MGMVVISGEVQIDGNVRAVWAGLQANDIFLDRKRISLFSDSDPNPAQQE